MTEQQIAIKQHLAKPKPCFGACGCLGQQMRDGKLEPAGPCAMDWYEIVNDKYFRIEEIRGETCITMEQQKLAQSAAPTKRNNL